MDKPTRVAFYMRVSTDEQTTDNQRHDLLKVADLRGWTVVVEYIDQGISGSKGREERPAFARLIADAHEGAFDMVASWAIDRLGRSVSHLVQFMDELRQVDIGLYLHQQQIDTSTAAGRAMLQMCGVFAELERSLISERIRTALALRKAQGVKLGSPNPRAGGEANRIRNLKLKGLASN